MTREELDNRQTLSEEGVDLFLIVDLEYPLELHDEHTSFPVLPVHLNGRLDAHLWDRREVGIRYETLKEAIKRGLVLKKIHSGIKSRDEAFVRAFIQSNNTEGRDSYKI